MLMDPMASYTEFPVECDTAIDAPAQRQSSAINAGFGDPPVAMAAVTRGSEGLWGSTGKSV